MVREADLSRRLSAREAGRAAHSARSDPKAEEPRQKALYIKRKAEYPPTVARCLESHPGDKERIGRFLPVRATANTEERRTHHKNEIPKNVRKRNITYGNRVETPDLWKEASGCLPPTLPIKDEMGRKREWEEGIIDFFFLWLELSTGGRVRG